MLEYMFDIKTKLGNRMAELVTNFACKRRRRSPRLETRETSEIKCRKINDGPLGFFELVPLEVKFIIFSYLRVEELSLLTISSKDMRNMIELYRKTSSAGQFRAIREMQHKGVTLSEKVLFCQQFQSLGLLMKRSTCLYTTRDRLKLLTQFMRKCLCYYCNSCQDPIQCIALTGFGRFLHTVIAGWDDKECARTFDFIEEHAHTMRSLSNILKFKTGTFTAQELHVRLFLRRVFIDQCKSKTDKAFWLNLILKSYPMVQQAKILFLLFGPLFGDELQWFDMCESAPVNKDHAQIYFGELANTFKLLHFHNKQWSEDTIISVIEEITCIPEEWLPENTANLLFLCGDCITLKFLSSKALNGRVQELGNIITSLCLVCWRHNQPITWTLEIVQNLCALMEHPKERISFLHAIVNTFREVILDLHEFGDTDDENSQDFQNMMEAHADFSREVITLAFQNILKPAI